MIVFRYYLIIEFYSLFNLHSITLDTHDFHVSTRTIYYKRSTFIVTLKQNKIIADQWIGNVYNVIYCWKSQQSIKLQMNSIKCSLFIRILCSLWKSKVFLISMVNNITKYRMFEFEAISYDRMSLFKLEFPESTWALGIRFTIKRIFILHKKCHQSSFKLFENV